MEYKDYIRELKNKCDTYLEEVELIGNEDAYTDSLLENIFEQIARLKDFYDKSTNMVKDEVKVVHTLDELKDYLEDKDWTVREYGPDDWDIAQSSPAGEDFSFSIVHNNDVEKAITAIKEYAYNFDTQEHIEMWVEARRNGVSGVPSTKELCEDAEAIQAMLDDIADNVNWCEQKTIGETLADAKARSERNNSEADLDNNKEDFEI